jgi:hypothetical protein
MFGLTEIIPILFTNPYSFAAEKKIIFNITHVVKLSARMIKKSKILIRPVLLLSFAFRVWSESFHRSKHH